MKPKPRKIVLGRCVDIRVTLVITQQNIEAWLVLFDEAVFEDQGLGLGVRDSHFDSRNPLHHDGSLSRVVSSVEVT